MFHSILKRQLKKVGVTPESCPSLEEWQEFLARVNRAYTEADQERYLLERSLTISSEEMQNVYEQLRQSETRYALAAQGANDGLWDWDLTKNEVYYSPRWREILGCDSTEADSAPRFWLDRIHPDDRGIVEAELAAHLEGNTQHFQNEHRVLHKNDAYRWVLSRGLAVRDENGKAYRLAGSLSDITERKQAEYKLQHDAMHDTLTGLPNRAKLMDRLSRSLIRNRHGSEYSFAILFLDLDRFKIINDSLGHLAGDQLLIAVANKLTALVRPDDMVARLGGDEFVILLDHIRDKKQVSPVANRIIKALSHPFRVAQQEVYTSTSIGIAFSASNYEKAENLLRDADIAMYRAKAKGKARFEIFDHEMHDRAVTLLQLENDLRHALQHDELSVHYQPIVSLQSGQMIGFEALARWIHPTRGFVPPSEFIPVAEDTDLIYPIGEWVLRESCRQLKEWDEQFPSSQPLIVSVNLSAKQLEKRGLVEQIQGILQETGLAAERLKLEITESVLMSNAEQSIVLIQRLRDLGICISIDDFGTGYSSLSYLHRFPIDTLKVDRSFVNGLGSNSENSEIVQTIILLAHNLGIDVVAEGVETDEQLGHLQQMKCGYGQGYLYSKPVAPAQAAELIQELNTSNSAPEDDQSSFQTAQPAR